MAQSTSATTASPSSTSSNREDLKQTAMLHAATQAPLYGLLPTRKITNKNPRVLMDKLATPSAAGHVEGNSTDTGVDQSANRRAHRFSSRSRLSRAVAIAAEQPDRG